MSESELSDPYEVFNPNTDYLCAGSDEAGNDLVLLFRERGMRGQVYIGSPDGHPLHRVAVELHQMMYLSRCLDDVYKPLAGVSSPLVEATFVVISPYRGPDFRLSMRWNDKEFWPLDYREFDIVPVGATFTVRKKNASVPVQPKLEREIIVVD